MPFLQVVKGAEPNRKYVLVKDKVVIGRSPDCDVVINLGAVSREHAHLLKDAEGGYVVQDLRSRNRTYVNEHPVDPESPQRLAHEDRIRICDYVYAFLDPAPVSSSAERIDDGSTVMSSVMSRSASVLEAQPAERLRALLEISNSLSRTIEVESLLPRILETLFQVFRQADRGFFIIRDAEGNIIPKAIRTRRERDEASARFSRTIISKCLDEAAAILSEDASQDSAFALANSVADFRIRSVMCAPLVTADGQALGVIQVDTQDRTKKFTQEDLQLLIAVCNQAAVAMENASLHENLVARQRFEREVELAREVQQTFLPASVPVVPGYNFFAYYQAARAVGGDFYNFVEQRDGRWAIAVGDVAGKGIPAALLMARVTGDIRVAVATLDEPTTMVAHLNNWLQQAGMVDRFVTFVLAILDQHQHKLTLVNAGHQTPVLRRADGRLEEIAAGAEPGLPLGLMEDFEYQSVTTDLGPGDVLVLCTDGIADATNRSGEQFGIDRCMEIFRRTAGPAPALGSALLQAVQAHANAPVQFDDLTLVCIGRDAEAP
ncbi:MAG TPA: SpoIIE family protein phosphatase [Gemmatales bacterium]|nr:SpoIIE family protein phosphatase [Gemmatales bacterium]